MMAILPSLGNGADGLLGFGTTSLPALENGADTLPGLVMTGPPEPESVSAPLQQATNDQHDRSSRCIRPTRLSRMPTRRRGSTNAIQQLNTNPNFSFRCT